MSFVFVRETRGDKSRHHWFFIGDHPIEKSNILWRIIIVQKKQVFVVRLQEFFYQLISSGGDSYTASVANRKLVACGIKKSIQKSAHPYIYTPESGHCNEYFHKK